MEGGPVSQAISSNSGSKKISSLETPSNNTASIPHNPTASVAGTLVANDPNTPASTPRNPTASVTGTPVTNSPNTPTSTPLNPTASVTSAPVTNNPNTPTSTPRTPVASSTTNHSIVTPRTALSAPPTSTMFTFSAGVPYPTSRSKDSPIPSIELPETLPDGLRDGGTPKKLPIPAPYSGSLDTVQEVNRSPPEHGIAAFIFGESREPSPFTFRKMHNATPEPSQTTEYTTDIPGATGLPDNSTIEELAKKLASSDLKDTSVSMSNHPGGSNLVPGSSIVRERTAHSRYNVKDERPPNEPYFNEQFQKALQKGKHIAGRIKDTLKACELAEDRESHVYSMIETATELHNFDAPAVCTIGIVGDSGVGKASNYLGSNIS